ncbi:MAG: TPM domain-containing protein [Eubacteriales bacterium]|nr:TPM domain-containing protein [Eubacteriales bacterium]
MKKIIAFLASLIMMIAVAFTAFAADLPSSDMRQAADSLDIAGNVGACMSEMGALHKDGVRLFDTGDLYSAELKDKIEEVLAGVSNDTGFDTVIVTTDGFSGKSAESYADDIYDEAGFAEDGVLFVLNMTDRELYVSTSGMAIRYLTDDRLDTIYDNIIAQIQQGNTAGAAAAFADGVLNAHADGIPEDQSNYNTQTGQYDNYKKKSLSIFEIISAAVISAISGFLPMNGVKKKYAMTAEKKQAESFNLAYRANSSMALAAGVGAAKLIDKHVTRVPIPKPTNNGGGRPGGSISSVHTSSGGHTHGGGGRKF